MKTLSLALTVVALAAPLALSPITKASIVAPPAATISHEASSALQSVYWRRYGYWYAGRYRWHRRYWGWRRWDGGRWYYR